MTRVKVCGLTRTRDVETAVEAGADAVGAVVDVPIDTPREISPAAAGRLFADVPPFVTTVLVTMPSDVEHARDLVEIVDPDAIQVHGGLSPAEVAELDAALPVDVIVAVDGADPDAASGYAHVADAILVDSTDERGGGGTGRTHDWTRTRRQRVAMDVPIVLAGGLTPENVADAIETVEPYAVDVSSGVEARGGVKDPEAVRQFVAHAKARRVDA